MSFWVVLSTGNYGDSDSSAGNLNASRKAAAKEPVAQSVMVRVQVWNETENRPLHEKAEIWLRGHGSWWIKSEVQLGAAAKNLAPREVGIQDKLYIYPDSRDGREIEIAFMMTPEMNPNGSDRDSIIVTIYDDAVEVVGLALEATGGEVEQRFGR